MNDNLVVLVVGDYLCPVLDVKNIEEEFEFVYRSVLHGLLPEEPEPNTSQKLVGLLQDLFGQDGE